MLILEKFKFIKSYLYDYSAWITQQKILQHKHELNSLHFKRRQKKEFLRNFFSSLILWISRTYHYKSSTLSNKFQFLILNDIKKFSFRNREYNFMTSTVYLSTFFFFLHLKIFLILIGFFKAIKMFSIWLKNFLLKFQNQNQ